MSMLEFKEVIKDKVVDERQIQQESKKEIIGSIVPKRGHTLYEINLKEHTIEPAEFEDQSVPFKQVSEKPTSKGLGLQTNKNGSKKIVLDGLPSVRKVLIRKKNCIYTSALNYKNVKKKLIKRGVIKIVKK